MIASRRDFGRVSEEGIHALIRGFHATCVTHYFPMQATPVYCVYSDKKNAYLPMKIGLRSSVLMARKQWYQEVRVSQWVSTLSAAVTVRGILQWCYLGFLNSFSGKAAVHSQRFNLLMKALNFHIHHTILWIFPAVNSCTLAKAVNPQKSYCLKMVQRASHLKELAIPHQKKSP